MSTLLRLAVLLPGVAAFPAHAQTPAADGGENGAYLSLEFGNGRMHGENPQGSRSMEGRAFEVRAGRAEDGRLGPGRIDFVHYNEGHPDNNHRDGFAVQWVAVRPLGKRLTGELGAGPYLSMNTTTAAGGRQIDDTNWGVLLSAALRLPLDVLPEGAHLRVGVNHALMPGAHRSTAVLVGIGRQFGETGPASDTEPSTGAWWLGASAGYSITNLHGTASAGAAVLEARRYLEGRFDHWALSGRILFEGDDGSRVDRNGVAGQVWYVQQVTPRLSISAGIGPYLAKNRRQADSEPEAGDVRANLLISFQAERALSRRTRVFANFNRVKTFRQTDDRDVLQVGVLKRF